MQEKCAPLRKCVGCGEMKPKSELVRIVKSKDMTISIDFEGKKSGRGAYICKNLECFKRAKKMRRLERSFSCKVSEEVYDFLGKELKINGC